MSSSTTLETVNRMLSIFEQKIQKSEAELTGEYSADQTETPENTGVHSGETRVMLPHEVPRAE